MSKTETQISDSGLSQSVAGYILLELLNGGFGFGVGLIALYLVGTYVPHDLLPYGKDVVYASKHIFVEVLEPDSSIYAEPSIGAPVVRSVGRGNILLQMNVARRGRSSWNEVYLGPEEAGWMIRVSAPKIGVPETRITYADKFYFRIRDIYALALGCVFFVWGFFPFRITPV